jgi:type IV secretory pathway ATPase VirB11/archaellum biosynthesis ATPase
MVEILDNEFKSLALTIITGHKEESSKQINEVKKSIQSLAEKFSNLDHKFSKERF